MITYDEAKAIALNFNKKVNSCYEYDKGFAFFEKMLKQTAEIRTLLLLRKQVKL